jgi:hypothetical protein
MFLLNEAILRLNPNVALKCDSEKQERAGND